MISADFTYLGESVLDVGTLLDVEKSNQQYKYFMSRWLMNKISFHNDLRIKYICQITVKTSFVSITSQWLCKFLCQIASQRRGGLLHSIFLRWRCSSPYNFPLLKNKWHFSILRLILNIESEANWWFLTRNVNRATI